MTLCVFIGSGPVGEYVADHIIRAVPACRIIGLEATRDWLPSRVSVVEFVAPLEFARCLNVLQDLKATEVIFAGDAMPSFNRPKPDGLAIRYVVARGYRALGRWPSFWAPHAYLDAVQGLLHDHGIALRTIIDYLPEMTAERGFVAGQCDGYDAERDLRAAIHNVSIQPWRRVRPACIVDETRILMPEVKSTNQLIEQFGKSSYRATAKFPVLCKFAVEPFEKINTPTIGFDTARLCADNGIRAIVVQGGKTILMQRSEVIELATIQSLCVRGI